MSMSEPLLPGSESLRFRLMLMTMAADPRDRDPTMATGFAQIRSRLQVLTFATVLALTACASLPPPTADLATAWQAVACRSQERRVRTEWVARCRTRWLQNKY